MNRLSSVHIAQDQDDSWRWSHESPRAYTVKSVYPCLQVNNIPIDGNFFRSFWIKIVPSKVISLAWRIIEEEENIKCVFFNVMDESDAHQSIFLMHDII